ncbi:MAG: virulence protein RhuM/Fic/DOC family protein [Saprospiraceae bacterium]|nr:virulence protein RhuM/Fic/DOC family protein [Saprospiraceae bacterium]
MNNQIEIYQSADHQTRVEVRFDADTVWLNQYQLADLFQTDRTSILKHIQNIYSTGELDERATCAKFAQVRKEGKRLVTRELLNYNLDVIISVGYRVNSKRGTQFRQWATQRLKEYLVQGYAINEKRLAEKQMQLQTLKTGIRIISRAIEAQAENAENESLGLFAAGLEMLDDYDHEALDIKGNTTREAVLPAVAEYLDVVAGMRSAFSSDVFAKPKDQSFESAVAQIGQSFGGQELYPSLEEKAAALLYLIVKNHGFVDGNKRIGAACFLYFLEKNNLLFNEHNQAVLSSKALATLTLFVAASKPEEMETVRKLIISILNRT